MDNKTKMLIFSIVSLVSSTVVLAIDLILLSAIGEIK